MRNHGPTISTERLRTRMDGILRNPHISFPPGTDGDVIVENKHFCVMVTFHLNAWCAPVCASRAATPTFCLRRRQIFGLVSPPPQMFCFAFLSCISDVSYSQVFL